MDAVFWLVGGVLDIEWWLVTASEADFIDGVGVKGENCEMFDWRSENIEYKVETDG